MSHQRPEVTTYLIIYVILLVLLGLTVEAARHDLGHLNFTVTILIAASKAILIGWFFMHLRQTTPLVRLVVVASLLWLGIMFALSLADYWTRPWDSQIDRIERVREVTR